MWDSPKNGCCCGSWLPLRRSWGTNRVGGQRLGSGESRRKERVEEKPCSERAREETREFSFHVYLGVVGGPVAPQGVTAHDMSPDPMQLPVCPGKPDLTLGRSPGGVAQRGAASASLGVHRPPGRLSAGPLSCSRGTWNLVASV